MSCPILSCHILFYPHILFISYSILTYYILSHDLYHLSHPVLSSHPFLSLTCNAIHLIWGINTGTPQPVGKTDEDVEIEMLFKEPYWYTGERSFLIPPGGSKTVTVHFLPLTMGTHNCQVTYYYCTMLYYSVLYRLVFYCTELKSALLYCALLISVTLYCTALSCNAMYCTVLYCTVINYTESNFLLTLYYPIFYLS